MCDFYHPLSCDTPAPTPGGYTRRRFLHHGLGLVSTAATVPAFLTHAGNALAADTTMRLASKSGVPDDRVLVVVQLSGGNDGLNTVVPYGFSQYYDNRPSLGNIEAEVLKLMGSGAEGIGLHPALTPLKELIDADLAGVIQGVGFLYPNRSHFVSMDLSHTADPTGRSGHGWIGKSLDSLEDPSGLECLSIGSSTPLAALGKTSRPVSFEKSDLFRWGGRDLHPSLSDAYDAVHNQNVAAGAEDPLAFVNRTAMDAQVASDKVRKAVGHASNTTFPRSGLANQLAMVAKMIRAELPTRIYYVTMGGFDTHAAQAANHTRLMQQFSDAMKAFYDELEATGHRSRVVSLAFSEFGRRVRQNASGGTAHGCAGPAFVFGDAVQSGLIGKHPSLDKLDNGDLIFNTDFRSVYSDLLQGWMKMEPTAALGRRFASANILS